MLSEDQRTRLRVLCIGAALVWIALGLVSGWPAWVWIALAVASAFVPPIVAYVQAERVLRRSGRGARRRSSRRSGAAEDSGGDADGGSEGGTLNAQESAPAVALAGRAPAPRRDATATDHALALVASLPPSQRHRFARDLARLLDDNELRTAARSVRQERAEAVRQEDARPTRSGATGTPRESTSSASSGSPGSKPRSTGARSTGARSTGTRSGPATRSSGRSIADDADPDDVVLAGVSPENRSAVENFLEARPRIHMPEPPAERVPARDSHEEADEDDHDDDG